MLQEQEKYKGERDEQEFIKDIEGGFSWADSAEGSEFWLDVIDGGNIELFFKKYPRKSPYPKVMKVWDAGRQNTHQRVVFAEKCNRFIAWEADTLEDAENTTITSSWDCAEDIQEEPFVLTRQQIAEKFGIDASRLIIEEDKKPDRFTYYIFGRDAVNILTDEGIEALKDEIQQDVLSYAMYAHNESNNSSLLAEQMDGWDSYAILSKEDFDLLDSI